jgi:uncharacterized protein RhaS with RHS repeats
VWSYDEYGRVRTVRRFATATSPELADERVEYYYDWLPAQFQDGTGFALPSGVPFTAENGLGRLVMTRTGASRILELYSYTDGGQMRRKRVEAAGQTLEVGYDFDAGGRVMLMTGVTGRKYRFTYDTSGRPWQLMRTQLEGGFPDYAMATAAYDHWGRLQSVGGMSYQYNSFGQLSRYTHNGYDVTYDCVGSRGLNDGTVASQTVNGALTSYTYDLLGRLDTATRSGQWSQIFDYDGFGNLIKKTTGPTGGPADEPADGSGDVRCGGEPHLEPERGL